MVDAIGWASTILVLIGFLLNAIEYKRTAMVAWLIGDAGWIGYDFMIDNYSHFTLSAIIIFINFYGLYRLIKK
jgi:large-conductance mechanosensitive channel